MKKGVRVVSLLVLMFVLGLSNIFSILAFAESDATVRQKAYIDYASEGLKVSESDIASLTNDEMRILGVFLSNFYIPWGTQLVETDDADLSREQMVSTLTDSLEFDESLATSIVEAVFQMSTDSAQELHLKLEYTKNGEIKDASPESFTYWDIMSILSNVLFGGNNNIVLMTDDGIAIYFKELSCLDVYWGTYSESTIVMDLLDTSSAPTLAFKESLKSLPMSKGIGLNLVSVPLSMEGSSLRNDNFKLVTDMLSSPSDLYNISCLGWTMYIDCFGNIIADCGTGRQYVVEPACMNPYVWQKDGYATGECLPLNSLAYFSDSDGGKLTLVGDSVDSSDAKIDLKLSDSANSSIKNWTLARGSSETKLTTFIGRLVWGKNSAEKASTELVREYWSKGHIPSGEVALLNLGGSINNFNFGGSEFFSGGTIDIDKTIMDFIMFDTYNEFSTDSTMALNEYGIFSDSVGSSLGSGVGEKFTNFLYDSKDNSLVRLSESEQKKYIAGIYCAYVFAYFETSGTADGGHVNFRFSQTNLPEISSGNIELSGTSSSEMQEEVLSMVYYLLHPDKGVSYVNKAVKTKVGGVLLDWHSDLVGNTGTGSTTGSTKYLGTTSYMTTPEITDLSWLNSLFNTYIDNMIYVLMFITIVMALYTISGYLSYQRAMLSIVGFSVCIYLIPVVITSLISYTNKISNSFYDNKFQYWGIVQHQAYITDLNAAVDTNNYGDYLITLFNSQSDTASNSTVVNLKWMCPKKDNYLVNIESELNESSNSSSLSTLLSGVISNQVSGEDYTKSANKTYLYRSYVDIASYSKYIYEGVGSTGKQVNGLDSLSSMMGYSGSYLLDSFNSYVSTSLDNSSLDSNESLGFNYDTTISELSNKRFFYFNRSNSLANATLVDTENVSDDLSFFGVPTSKFNFTIGDFNSNISMPAESVSLSVFALYSESPFYYLNWNIRDQLSSSSSTSDYPVKSLLLSTSSTAGINDYFFNVSESQLDSDSYGQLRDYMDMRSLFTIVIPYLKACNSSVVEFDDLYGLSMIGDYRVSYSTDSNGNMTLDVPYGLNTLTDDNKDSYYSYWHDVQVANLFNMYTPWVDSMYSCSYSESETVSVAGVDFVIEDPLDPSSYPDERPMVFSESERIYYGLEISDLTKVEQKVLEINENCYSSLASVMNYYTFNTDVLTTAVAMLETFEFNRVFSETKIFGDSNELYPQGYELKNFSFDAYFRLILSETTNLDLNTSQSIYSTVVANTSIFTAVLILAVDISAIWLVPFLRLSFIVCLFVALIVATIYSCVSGGDDFKVLLRGLYNSAIAPLFRFLFITVTCAYLVSLFLSSGAKGVTGSLDYTISLGDPILAMFVLLTINGVLIFSYIKILWAMLKDIKKKGKAVQVSASSAALGLVSAGVASISPKKDSKTSAIHSTVKKAGGNLAPKLKSKPRLKKSSFSASEREARQELKDRRVAKKIAKSEELNKSDGYPTKDSSSKVSSDTPEVVDKAVSPVEGHKENTTSKDRDIKGSASSGKATTGASSKTKAEGYTSHDVSSSKLRDAQKEKRQNAVSSNISAYKKASSGNSSNKSSNRNSRSKKKKGSSSHKSRKH